VREQWETNAATQDLAKMAIRALTQIQNPKELMEACANHHAGLTTRQGVLNDRFSNNPEAKEELTMVVKRVRER
jgi:hypothetical protein